MGLSHLFLRWPRSALPPPVPSRPDDRTISDPSAAFTDLRRIFCIRIPGQTERDLQTSITGMTLPSIRIARSPAAASHAGVSAAGPVAVPFMGAPGEEGRRRSPCTDSHARMRPLPLSARPAAVQDSAVPFPDDTVCAPRRSPPKRGRFFRCGRLTEPPEGMARARAADGGMPGGIRARQTTGAHRPDAGGGLGTSSPERGDCRYRFRLPRIRIVDVLHRRHWMRMVFRTLPTSPALYPMYVQV